MKPLLRVRQKASTIGQVEHMRKIVRGLGLRGLGSEVIVQNSPSFRGMVKKVMHLVEFEELAEAPKPKTTSRAKAAPRPSTTK
jgi:large subunit ribosomal protein L30